MAQPPEPNPPRSIHDAYVAEGPTGYYQRAGADYRNPHEPVVRDLIVRSIDCWPLDLSHVLDLAAGSGEATLALSGVAGRVSAIDPYTGEAYRARTGRACEAITFEQIGDGALRGRAFSLVVCSFAMHLVEASRLPLLCWELAQVARQLLILTPHKRPLLRPEWGWTQQGEILRQRVRARWYQAV